MGNQKANASLHAFHHLYEARPSVSLIFAFPDSIGRSDASRDSPSRFHCHELRPVVADEGAVFRSPAWSVPPELDASFDSDIRGNNHPKGRRIMAKGRRSTGRQAQMMPEFASMTDQTVAGIGPPFCCRVSQQPYDAGHEKTGRCRLTGEIGVPGGGGQGRCPNDARDTYAAQFSGVSLSVAT